MKKKLLFSLFAVVAVVFLYFFVGTAPLPEHIAWGVNFSQKHASYFGLDWQKTYLALIDDLQVKRLKIALHWDLIEPAKDQFYFQDFDWQAGQAQTRNATILAVIGMKTPRWPECHIPDWAKGLSKAEQQEEILEMIQAVVERYKHIGPIWGWQVENEPFFAFGDCPWADSAFFRKEVALVKALDPNRPVIATASGEGSLWTRAARTGDIVGTTLYRKVWFGQLHLYVNYPFPPVFYWRKAELIDKLFDKKVIGVELQAEPWGPALLYDLPLDEQKKTMDAARFRKNIEFAKRTGLDEFYLWGAEWWYWMKAINNDPSLWEEARKLFLR